MIDRVSDAVCGQEWSDTWNVNEAQMFHFFLKEVSSKMPAWQNHNVCLGVDGKKITLTNGI